MYWLSPFLSMHASVQVHSNVLMPGLALHLALGLAYHMPLSVHSMSPFAISWLSIWRRTIMCLLSQYQYWNSKQSAVEFIFHISSDCLTFWLTCDLRSVSSAYVHRCMTRRVHPFLFLHVGVVLLPNICERFHGHGSRFIWILQPQYSLLTVCFALGSSALSFLIVWQHHWLPSIVREWLAYCWLHNLALPMLLVVLWHKSFLYFVLLTSQVFCDLPRLGQDF